MTACLSCADFNATGEPALYSATCIDCKARALAHGPLYFASAKGGRPTDEYKAALVKVFGGDYKAGHQRVRQYAERMANMKIGVTYG